MTGRCFFSLRVYHESLQESRIENKQDLDGLGAVKINYSHKH